MGRSTKGSQLCRYWIAEWIFNLFNIAQQIGGRDVEETFSTLQADLEMAERYDLKINLMPLGSKTAAKPEIDKGDENEIE